MSEIHVTDVGGFGGVPVAWVSHGRDFLGTCQLEVCYQKADQQETCDEH
jgi:hypothetical protein